MVLTRVSIQKPLAMIMVILAVVLFGIFSFTRLPIDMMPEIDLPFVVVRTMYIGAGPEEIEASVVKPIEEQMMTITGLKNITAYCMEGVGFILCEFDMDIDVDIAAIEVKDKIDKILYELPEDLEKPVIDKFNPNDLPIVTLALTGPASPEKLRRMADKQIKERLVRIAGVANIEVTGGREREIQVNLKKEKLDAHNLTLFQIFPVISSQSVNIPSGHVTGSLKEYTVRVKGEFESVDEIARLQIPTSAGYSVELSEIAEIQDTYKEIREKARFNGMEAVSLAILKRPDANTVEVAKKIFSLVERINTTLPKGFELSVAEERSKFIENSVNDTYSSMFLGIVFTALILLVFLYDWKLMLIAAITMPTSVIMALAGMAILGFTLNIVTLMALSISVGILVTNAIIVLENIVRKLNQGMPVRQAAETGTSEIMVAVIASTLTNLAVFIPIATTGGITGNIFRALGLTIVFATVASLFLSFTLTPLMASRMLKNRADTTEGKNAIDRFMESVERKYAAIVRHIVYEKKTMALLIIGVVVVLGISINIARTQIGSEFMSQGDMGYLTVSVEMPPGTPLAVTDRVISAIEQELKAIKEVKTAVATIGGSGTNTGVYYGSVVIKLVDKDERRRSAKQIVNAIRPLLADLPDAQVFVSEMKMMGGRSEADIDVEVTGYDMNKILAYADSVKNKMKEMKGLTDIKLSYKGAIPEIQIVPDRDRMDHYGLNAQTLGMGMRFNMSGYDRTVYREENEDYPIRIQIEKEDRNTVDEVENLTMLTPKGLVPIKAVTDISYTGGASSINRKNRLRMVNVYANVSEGSSGKKVAELKERIQSIPLEEGYGFGFGGSQELMEESFGQLIIAGVLAIILTYMVLAGILESLTMALVIWLTLPLGIIGVVWALYLTGNTFSMLSNMSMIMLIGIVVNNAILLIDYARQARKSRGITPQEAIIESGKTKLKAILMMNLAIILAMLPQALALGSGGEIRAPFAITAIGGILVSTVLTLFIIPALYVITAPRKIEQPQ